MVNWPDQPVPGQRDRRRHHERDDQFRNSLHAGADAIFSPSTQPQSNLLPGGTYLVSDVGGRGNDRSDRRYSNRRQRHQFHDICKRHRPGTYPSADPVSGPQISNFFIGGQTDNVILVAPSGSRECLLRPGHGQHLHQHRSSSRTCKANRGAIGSAVTVNRTIGNMVMGGDVINSLHSVGLPAGTFRRCERSGNLGEWRDRGGCGRVQRRGSADDREPDLQCPSQLAHLQSPGSRRRTDSWTDRGQRDQFDHLGFGRPEPVGDQ